MAKILSITLNPAIDLTVQLDQLKVGEVNRQLTAQSHAAGKGLNVAQVLKDLGHELIVSGFLGQENRQIFDHHIQQEQFDNQFIYVAGITTSVSDKEYSAAMHKGNRLAATKCVFEKQQLPPHLQAITRLSEDSLARL
jgi:1-phosphofructokinase